MVFDQRHSDFAANVLRTSQNLRLADRNLLTKAGTKKIPGLHEII